MNNFKKLLLVSVAALGGLGLVACEPGTPGESGTSQSPVATASRINSTLGTTPFAIGTQVDLDEYITVVYTDNKEDKNFTVQCISANASDLTIDGHVVTTAVAGTYTVEVRSGDNARTMRIPLDFRTEEVMEEMYLDGFLKIAKLEGEDIAPVLDQLNHISEQFKVKMVLSISMSRDALPESAKSQVI